MAIRYSSALGFLLLLSGCAHWSDVKQLVDRDKLPLPKARMSPDAVVLEAIFLRLNESQDPGLQSVWSMVDEQALDIDLRRRLDANGIRAGIITGDMPSPVQDWLKFSEKRRQEELLEQAQLAADVSSSLQRFQCRSGKPKDLVIRTLKQGDVSIFHVEGSAATGKTYEQPTLLLEVTSKPHGDGTASLSLLPEIQFGQSKAMLIGENTGFRHEYQRESVVFKDLKMESLLRPGQTLMATCSFPPRGIGEHFFQSITAEGHTEKVVLLIRLAQTQLDDLFAPKSASDTK